MKKRQIRDWAVLIKEQEQSGKTINDFCKEKNIHYTAFYKNRKIIQGSNFVEIKVNPKSQEMEVPIVLNFRDFSIKLTSGFNKKTLKDIISVLEDI